MAVNLSPVGGVAAQFFDNSGQVLTGGLLYSYLAGTTTPATTYTSNSGITAHPNPIVLNAAGRVPDSGEIWLTDGVLYKFALKDSNGVQIATYDNIDGINSNFIAYTSETEVQTATQGQTVFTLADITYIPVTNNLAVYVNGSKQISPTNFVETDSTTVTFVSGLNVGDVVEFSTATPVATNVIDAANVSYNEGDTGAINRNVEQKLQEMVSVKDFGATGDGVTDDTTAIQTAFTNVNGKALFFPSGTYLCSNQITSTGVSVIVQGQGVNASRIVFNDASGGFAFALTAQTGNTPPDQLYFCGLTIESQATVSSPALSATWSAYQPNAQGSAWIKDLNITRSDDATGSFTDGIKLTNCIVGTISDVVILGDDLRVSDTGINLVDCIGILSTKVQVNRYKTGASITKVSAASVEGFIFDQSYFYDVYRGVFADTALAVNITNTHVNINGASATVGIDLVDCSQSFICDGCLIYAGGLVTDPSGQIGIRLTGNGNNVNNIRFVAVQPANVACGISILAGYTSVFNSNFDSAPVGILVVAGSTSTYLSGNQFYDNTTPITDNGTNTVRYGNSVNGPVFSNIDSIRWASGWGTFADRQISSNSSWGAYIRGAAGTTADVSLVTSGGNALVNVKDGVAGVYPQADNTYSMGTAALRWSVVYAGTGTINTSDERNKQDIKDLSALEKEVAMGIKGLIKSFRFKDAVERKGDKARIHFGVMAQQVAEAFKIVGLDPNDYALFCYDEWEADAGVEAGNRYGIRYDELLAFVISAL